MKRMLIAALAATLPAVALAQSSIQITDAYARSANPKSGAAFMTIVNAGSSDCTLSSVSGNAAEMIELHTNEQGSDGVVKMTKLKDGITIPAGAEHKLMRGGDHIMMMGLNAPLETGQDIAMSLNFGECGAVDLVIPVDNDRKPDASDAMPMQHGAHGEMKAPN
ncbi:copper chaperone PCu(A)C [Paracoccus aurantiacus]|uniref:Copper chaperone PCu(A)C n=1 Tax=Paracoccus aurantiacus TaxID=2599412 RepID=A0A5C6S687_9RHOB|nr:copper chaperone PCu(A)C [Paracoccus aurantiacus]TXB69827.1 copper chaperone PCu(A)C [Paracoccus aurantiacus]